MMFPFVKLSVCVSILETFPVSLVGDVTKGDTDESNGRKSINRASLFRCRHLFSFSSPAVCIPLRGFPKTVLRLPVHQHCVVAAAVGQAHRAGLQMIVATVRQSSGNFFTPEQVEAARAYHSHHFCCSVCLQAGRRYGDRCMVGKSLWLAYQSPVGADAAEGAPLAGKGAAAVAGLKTSPHGNHGDNLRSVQK